MYQNLGNVAYINGSNGAYGLAGLQNPINYSKNAINNYQKYIKDFKFETTEMPDLSGLTGLSEDKFESKMQEMNSAIAKINAQKMPPVNFSCTYMPTSKIDTVALMAVAYEEMEKRTSVSTNEMTQMLQSTADLLTGQKGSQMSAQSLDINNDGQIDVAEYGASILVEDALSADKNLVDSRNINGTFNNQGENALFAYGVKNNYALASATFKGIYQMYGLDRAQNEFLSNPNNLV